MIEVCSWQMDVSQQSFVNTGSLLQDLFPSGESSSYILPSSGTSYLHGLYNSIDLDWALPPGLLHGSSILSILPPTFSLSSFGHIQTISVASPRNMYRVLSLWCTHSWSSPSWFLTKTTSMISSLFPPAALDPVFFSGSLSFSQTIALVFPFFMGPLTFALVLSQQHPCKQNSQETTLLLRQKKREVKTSKSEQHLGIFNCYAPSVSASVRFVNYLTYHSLSSSDAQSEVAMGAQGPQATLWHLEGGERWKAARLLP